MEAIVGSSYSLAPVPHPRRQYYSSRFGSDHGMKKLIRGEGNAAQNFPMTSLPVSSGFFHLRISLTRKFISEKIPTGFTGHLFVMLAVESDRAGFESQLCAS